MNTLKSLHFVITNGPANIHELVDSLLSTGNRTAVTFDGTYSQNGELLPSRPFSVLINGLLKGDDTGNAWIIQGVDREYGDRVPVKIQYNTLTRQGNLDIL